MIAVQDSLWAKQTVMLWWLDDRAWTEAMATDPSRGAMRALRRSRTINTGTERMWLEELRVGRRRLGQGYREKWGLDKWWDVTANQQ